MLCMSKKTEYALAALGHLAEQPGRVASAREIAAAQALPAPLLINILKNLQGHGLLRSTRGVKGGYQVAQDLATVSLHELIAIVECEGHSADGDCGCLEHAQDAARDRGRNRQSSPHGPVQALQFKLVRFLREVRVADLVLPGRRIDVPVERLTLKDNSKVVQDNNDRRLSHADHAL
jgi:Rrf2 family protein